MERLPPELVTFILSKLDGQSLACAARVCQLWHRIVAILSEAFNIWYKVCLKEQGLDSIIARTGLTQMLTRSGQKAIDLHKEQWEFWRELYGAYKRCNCLNKESWAYESGHVKGDYSGFVTAMALVPHVASTNGHLLLGTSEGHIHGGRLYKNWFSSFENKCLGWTHVNGCTDMANVTVGGCAGFSTADGVQPTYFVVSTGIQGGVIVSDAVGHRKITVEPRHHQALCVSSLGPYFVVGHESCLTRGLVIYKLVMERLPGREKSTVALLPVVKLSGLYNSSVRAVALAHSQVVAGDDHGILYSWTIPPLSNFDGSTSRSTHMVDVPKPTVTVQVKHAVDKILIHKDQVFVLCAVGCGLFVLDNSDWSKIYLVGESLIRKLIGNSDFMVSLAVSGDLLAIGCRSGEVVLFDVKSKKWAQHLQPHLITSLRGNMHHLVTLKLSDDGQGTLLMMAGSEVCWVRWRKKKLLRKPIRGGVVKEHQTTSKVGAAGQSQTLNRMKHKSVP